MSTGHLILSEGTTACEIAQDVKKELLKLSGKLPIQFLFEDTAFFESFYEDLFSGTPLIQEFEKIDIGDVPLQDIYHNPEKYLLSEKVNLEMIRNISRLTDGGPLIPACVYVAALYYQKKAEEKIVAQLHKLQSVRPALRKIEIWIVGSVPSTTARALILVRMICIANLLKREGIRNASINTLILDGEGLILDRRERETISGAFWLEMERVAENISIPLYQDRQDPDQEETWENGLPSNFVFRFCGKAGDQTLESVEDLKNIVVDWFLAYFSHSVVQEEIDKSRIRAVPLIHSTDQHPEDPKPRLLSSSAIVMLDLGSQLLEHFAEFYGSEQILHRLLGTGGVSEHFSKEIQLHFSQMVNTFNAISNKISSNISEEVGQFAEFLKTTNQPSSWQKEFRQIQRNLDGFLQLAGKSFSSNRKNLLGDFEKRMGKTFLDLLQKDGAKAAVSFFDQTIPSQIKGVKKQLEKYLHLKSDLNKTQEFVEEALSKASLFSNNKIKKSVIGCLLKSYKDTDLRISLAHELLKLCNSLETVSNQFKEKARTLVLKLEKTLKKAQLAKEILVQNRPSKNIQLILKPEHFEEIIQKSNVFGENLDAIVAELGKNPNQLTAFSEKAMLEFLVKMVVSKTHLSSLGNLAFEEYFQRVFPDSEQQSAILKWLVENTINWCGTLTEGYSQKMPDPAVVSQKLILMPRSMQEFVEPYLGLMTGFNISYIENFQAMVAICENHAYPLWAFGGICQNAQKLPNEPEKRAPYVSALWAQEWLPTITHYIPLKGFSEEDVALLAITLNVLPKHEGVFAMPSAEFFSEPLGINVKEVTSSIQKYGFQKELKMLIMNSLAFKNIRGCLQDAMDRKQISASIASGFLKRLLEDQKWISYKKGTPLKKTEDESIANLSENSKETRSRKSEPKVVSDLLYPEEDTRCLNIGVDKF